jgi:UDP-N-acetylmuramoyl-tripeptide--D-alanyl-D-alanine ligase
VTDPFWTLARAGAALGHPHLDQRPLRAVCSDTRQLAAGDCFVALVGERFDAHDFLGEAVTRGAAALVVQDVARAAGLGVPVLTVPDTRVALGALARARRDALQAPVVAIGGSNGKTTTKELARAALGARFAVHATARNDNNAIGVPQTLLAAPATSDVLVVEAGTNHPGELAVLRDILRPDVVLITTVQEEHLEGFGDLAGVLAEEASLADGAPLALVPVDEPAVVAAVAARAQQVRTFGLMAGDVHPDAWGLGADGRAWLRFGAVTMTVPAPGAHNAANAVAVVALARAFGLDDAVIAEGLAAAVLPPMRSGVAALGAALLLDDAYNANPGSMRAALALLAAVAGPRPRVALLGGMRELGVHEADRHDALLREALASGLTLLGVVGACAAAAARVAPDHPGIVSGEDPVAVWAAMAPRVAPDAAILLKGSRGERLERVRPALAAWAGVS